MYVVMRRYYATRPGARETILKKVREIFMPIVSQLPGFVEYFAVDAGDGALIFVSVTEDRGTGAASIKAAADFVREAGLTPLFSGGPEYIQGPMALHRGR
jgi:hypothetical protein